MGLYSLPGPYEGMMCVVTVNIDNFVSFFQNIFRTILHVFGIRRSSSTEQPAPAQPQDVSQTSAEWIEFDPFNPPLDPSDAYIEEFRNRAVSIRFDLVQSGGELNNDCTVCLTKFEPESEVNRLACGHVFHRRCLEQWLDYWNVVCPLCRSPLMPEEEAKYFGVKA